MHTDSDEEVVEGNKRSQPDGKMLSKKVPKDLKFLNQQIKQLTDSNKVIAENSVLIFYLCSFINAL